MSWLDKRGLRTLAALALIAMLAPALGGCFQPMYGNQSAAANGGVRGALSGIDVKQIVAANGTPLARLAVEVRNNLLFDLTGGAAANAPTHQLEIKLSANTQSTIIDINTARADIQQYGLDATYTLRDVSTNRIVVSGQTFARVSFDTPGQQQRFVGARALRDAEDRAAKQIADQIHSRLASYFVAGA